tara:strand:- start:375 stop:818 length:444 start_codon:yes stop_codon:yes gene_type:complete
MKITKTQLRQIVKEEIQKELNSDENLQERFGDKYITPSYRDRQWRPPARGSAPGTSGRLPDQTTKGAEELPKCLFDRNGNNLDRDNRMSWAKAAGEGLAAGAPKGRCAMPREKVAWIDKKPYEYDTFEGGLQKDDKGNPIPKDFSKK